MTTISTLACVRLASHLLLLLPVVAHHRMLQPNVVCCRGLRRTRIQSRICQLCAVRPPIR